MAPGCLGLALLVVVLLLTPVFMAQVTGLALLKLGISPPWVSILVVAILLGTFVNVPVWRRRGLEAVLTAPPSLFGVAWGTPRWRLVPSQQSVYLNLGGCIVPVGIAFYEIWRLLRLGGQGPFLSFLVILAATTWAAHIGSNITDEGVVLNPFLPAAIAVLGGHLMYPGIAPIIAFPAGVMGVLIGADLLRLNSVIRRTSLQGISIGGAGTFDGVLIAGLMATLLA